MQQQPQPTSTQAVSSGAGSGSSGPLTRAGQHPLQTNWKFWYFQRFFQAVQEDGNNGAAKSNKFDSYKERLKDLGQISTIEQFFQYFVYMKKPSEMPREIDLFFFREGEIPMWEVLIMCKNNLLLGESKRRYLDHQDQEGGQH